MTNPFKVIDVNALCENGYSEEIINAKQLILKDLLGFFEKAAEVNNLRLSPLIERYNTEKNELKKFLNDNKGDLSLLFGNASSNEKVEIEKRYMQKFSALIEAVDSGAFELILGYALTIELVRNSEEVKSIPNLKPFDHGPTLPENQLPWIKLVNISTNFARHHQEWFHILWQLIDKGNKLDYANLEKIAKVSKLNGPHSNLLQLFKVSEIRAAAEFSGPTNLPYVIVETLNLGHEFEGLLQFQGWLLRIQQLWVNSRTKENLLNSILMPSLKVGASKRYALKRLLQSDLI